MKFNATLMNIVEKILKVNKIPMLLGEPGIGKSSWVIDLGRIMHTEVFILACNQLADKADLTGARLVPLTDKDGSVIDYEQVFYPHSVINQAIHYAEEHPNETPILFMDELNRTTPDVTSEALSIPTLRSIGNKKLPNNLRIITAGNDKGNITSLDEASVSRFVLLHVEPETATYFNIEKNINPFVANVLKAHPELLFCKTIKVAAGTDKDDDDKEVDIDEILDDGDEMNQFTTPRTVSGVSQWLNTCTNQELLDMLGETYVRDGIETSTLQETLEGFTGKTNFTIQLLAEIANGITTINNQSNVPMVGKPQCYDEFKSQTDAKSLENYIATMSDNDKSGCLVYMVFDSENNGRYINALMQNINQLTPPDMKTLMGLYSANQLNEGNVSALLKAQGPLHAILNTVMAQ